MSNCNPEEQLFCKILSGDKSDNIPNIFRGCGPKTALKYFKDKKSFEEKLKDKSVKQIYELNKKIIDMSNIPDNLKKEFYENNLIKEPQKLKDKSKRKQVTSKKEQRMTSINNKKQKKGNL